VNKTPSSQKIIEHIHFLVYPEDENEVLKLRAQKKPFACYLPFKVAHTWSPNKNGIRYCSKCGKVDFYFGITGMIRKFMENKQVEEKKRV
jgi:hypothetical protein